MNIYFKTRKKPQNMTGIKELLRTGFGLKSNYGTFKETFKDPKCTIPECHPARRSFGDLLDICRTHFPNTTEQELAKVMFELHDEIGLGGSVCGTINKPVFFVRGKGLAFDTYFQGPSRTYKGKSKYSFKMIEDFAKEK